MQIIKKTQEQQKGEREKQERRPFSQDTEIRNYSFFSAVWTGNEGSELMPTNAPFNLGPETRAKHNHEIMSR